MKEKPTLAIALHGRTVTLELRCPDDPELAIEVYDWVVAAAHRIGTLNLVAGGRDTGED